MYKLPNNTKLLSINIIYTENIAKTYINHSENLELKQYKNTIDEDRYQTHWDKFKKLTNPYEFIHIPKKKNNKYSSISKYIPLSRSYFKLWEILKTFNLLTHLNNKRIKTAHIAEGPGGFMECLVNYRNVYKTIDICDEVYGITLKSSTKDIPGWNKAQHFIKKNKIFISYGKDNTGDIYNIENILDFKKTIGNNKCYLITSDGGFDFSVDFNNQEQLAYRLIFCEFVTAISIQALGGCQIIKIFDIYTKLTVKLLYIFSVLYEEVYIYKPLTSRPANSEKYIIAKKFKGIDESYLKSLYGIIRLWCSIKKNNFYIEDLFLEDVPEYFKKDIEKFNESFIKKQITSIKNTLHLINNKPDIKEYNNLLNSLINNAKDWCTKYDIEINKNSKYLINK